MNAFYIGNARHVLDEKNRLAIPAKWRPAVKDAGDFGVFPWPNGCLIVLPPAVLQKFQEQLSSISIGDFDSQDTLRRLMVNAEMLSVDKWGRMTLSDNLLAHAGIEKEALFVGMVRQFEIWSPERYDPAKPVTQEDMQAAMRRLKIQL